MQLPSLPEGMSLAKMHFFDVNQVYNSENGIAVTTVYSCNSTIPSTAYQGKQGASAQHEDSSRWQE